LAGTAGAAATAAAAASAAARRRAAAAAATAAAAPSRIDDLAERRRRRRARPVELVVDDAAVLLPRLVAELAAEPLPASLVAVGAAHPRRARDLEAAAQRVRAGLVFRAFKNGFLF